jgi:hypothetical protein
MGQKQAGGKSKGEITPHPHSVTCAPSQVRPERLGIMKPGDQADVIFLFVSFLDTCLTGSSALAITVKPSA